jgi:EmrB/QacA subfamily drug resistance transporter
MTWAQSPDLEVRDVAAGSSSTELTGSPGKTLALIAMLFAVAMTFIDQTIVAIASPTIQQELSLTRSGTQWVVNAYLLALAATFALGGRMADVLGHRRMVTIGITGFAVSSALCGATPTGAVAQTWILTFRVTQGVSAAVMIPAALAVVVAAFPINERGRALAVFFGVSGALTAIGPIAGGYLTQWTWRAIFWINIPVAIVALILTKRAEIPPSRRDETIDYRGAVLIALGMGLSVLGFEQAPTWGWHNPATWACIIGGLGVLAVFVLVELRTRVPLMKVRIFRDRAFVVDNAVLFFSMVAFVPVFFFASVYSQVSLGYDANRAGLYLFVFFAGFAPAAQVGGRMLDRGGARRPIIIGSALSAVGFALWASKVTDLHLSAQWPYILVASAGIGLILGPASTDAVNRSIDASYGEVTGITQTVRNYASTLSIAVLGTVLTTVLTRQLKSSMSGLGLPRGAAVGIVQRISGGSNAAQGSVPATVQAQIHAAIQRDYALGMRWVLIGMAVALGCCFVVALSHPGGSSQVELAATEPLPAAA